MGKGSRPGKKTPDAYRERGEQESPREGETERRERGEKKNHQLKKTGGKGQGQKKKQRWGGKKQSIPKPWGKKTWFLEERPQLRKTAGSLPQKRKKVLGLKKRLSGAKGQEPRVFPGPRGTRKSQPSRNFGRLGLTRRET